MKPYNFMALRVAAAITATDTGAAVDITDYTGNGSIFLNSSACTGADNVSAVKVQHSPDGTTWTDTGLVFDNVTNAGASQQVIYTNFDVLDRYVRAVNTLTGTTPGVTYAVEMVAESASY